MNMKIVIEIPEEIYMHLLERYKYQNTDDIGLSELDKVGVSIKNGTPLPEHHGRIIDESKINKCYMPVNGFDVRGIRTDAPTIIEGSESE